MLDDTSSMRRLYASTIIQALIDATNISNKPADKVHRAQALAWFTTSVGVTAQDFEEVCLSAEIDPNRVRKFVKEYNGPPLTLHILSRMRDEILGKANDPT